MRPSPLASAETIVVKVGSSLITRAGSGLDLEAIARLAGLMALDNIGGDGDLEGLSEAQAVFLDLILAQQVADIEQGRPATNKVAVASLSARDRDRLREALKAVAHLDELTRDLLF